MKVSVPVPVTVNVGGLTVKSKVWADKGPDGGFVVFVRKTREFCDFNPEEGTTNVPPAKIPDPAFVTAKLLSHGGILLDATHLEEKLAFIVVILSVINKKEIIFLMI